MRTPLTVYTGGTFDLIHPGHVALLAECRRLAGGGRVVVALNRDEFIERYKGRPPVMAYEDRAAVLRAFRDVDEIVENSGDEDSRPAILAVRPDLIVVGADWRERDYHAQMGFSAVWLRMHRIELRYAELLPARSSTRLRIAARAAIVAGAGS